MGLEMFSLEGKVAVITGASRGIGRAIAVGLAEAGADVAIAARSEEDLKTLVKQVEGSGRQALAIRTDVTERAQIEALMERTLDRFGTIDVLVNNAGGTRFVSPIMGLRPEGWDKVIRLNLTSVYHATQVGAQAMLQSGGGSIIQVASVAGIQGAQTLSFYSAAKGGVRLMTQAVAKELAQSGIRVNCIAPGWVATELNRPLRADEATRKATEAMVPMGRFGEPEEVVGAAIFLASDASSFVTGTTVVVDGGQTA